MKLSLFARAALILSVCLITGKQVMKNENVPEVLAVMATAGLYDDSGQWLYLTGLPAKSGVGGGSIAGSVWHCRHLSATGCSWKQSARPKSDR